MPLASILTRESLSLVSKMYLRFASAQLTRISENMSGTKKWYQLCALTLIVLISHHGVFL